MDSELWEASNFDYSTVSSDPMQTGLQTRIVNLIRVKSCKSRYQWRENEALKQSWNRLYYILHEMRFRFPLSTFIVDGVFRIHRNNSTILHTILNVEYTSSWTRVDDPKNQLMAWTTFVVERKMKQGAQTFLQDHSAWEICTTFHQGVVDKAKSVWLGFWKLIIPAGE